MSKRTLLATAMLVMLSAPAWGQSSHRTAGRDSGARSDAGSASRLYYHSQPVAHPSRIIHAQPLVARSANDRNTAGRTVLPTVSSTTTQSTATTLRSTPGTLTNRGQSRPSIASGSRIIRNTAADNSGPRIYVPGRSSHQVVTSLRPTTVVRHDDVRVISPAPLREVTRSAWDGPRLHTPVRRVEHYPSHLGTYAGYGYYPLGVYSHPTVFASSYNCYPQPIYRCYTPRNYCAPYSYGYSYYRGNSCYPRTGFSFGYSSFGHHSGFSIRIGF